MGTRNAEAPPASAGGASRGVRTKRDFLKPGRRCKALTAVFRLPRTGAWRRHGLSNPCEGLVGSKSKASPPHFTARNLPFPPTRVNHADGRRHDHEGLDIRAIIPAQASRVPARDRDARRLGGVDLRLRSRAGLGPLLPHARRLPADLGDRRARRHAGAADREITRGARKDPRGRQATHASYGAPAAGRDSVMTSALATERATRLWNTSSE